jgi:hypothetical protein
MLENNYRSDWYVNDDVYLYMLSWLLVNQFFFTVFRLLTDFVCLYNYEFWVSLSKIVRSWVILLLPLFIKNRNFFKWPKLLYFMPECAQIWTV